MPTEHRLERRARLLAERMRDASETLALQLGAGDRVPFTTAMTKNESLAWWRAHRHDEWGEQALGRMQPWDIAQLDLDLARAMNGEPASQTPFVEGTAVFPVRPGPPQETIPVAVIRGQ